MPVQLLPASAQAFAPRADPEIVLNSKAEPWLTQTLKRINKVKRPLNNVVQHRKCLIETLGGANAIWTLASLMLPKAPEADLRDEEAMFNFQLLHVEAYVVHVDMVAQNEVAFKLTAETIDGLVAYHQDIYSVDAAASTWSWPDKDAQVKKLHAEFVQAVNKFVFRTDVRALEGLEEEGAGELLDGRSALVKAAIMNLFLPLLPPPPRIVEVIHPAPLLPNLAVPGTWWASPPPAALPSSQPLPLDGWKVLPSTPSPTITTCSEPAPAFWPDLGVSAFQLPSPTPSLSPPAFPEAPFFASPECIAPLPVSMFMPQNCGADFAGFGDFDAFGLTSATWAPLYMTTV